MSSRALSRRTKAVALVPLALLSGVWTTSLISSSATATSASEKVAQLPDGTAVPADAIQAPASVPVPGVIAPAVPQGAADSVVSGASSNGIPAPALSAYQRGAQIIDAADKSCNIPWELIAAIGRVESDHGRYNNNTLTQQGVSSPGIYGIALNGKNGTQAVQDTDGGQLDKDTVYDRAVGGMQFIPSTWQVVKVDADGDGKRDPQDIDDAALATSVYLCSGKDNLSTRQGQEAAVYRYNHSKDYVNLVLRIMEAYSSGDYTALPSGTQGGGALSPGYSSAITRSYRQAEQRKLAQVRAKKQRQQALTGGSGGGLTGGSGSGGTTGTLPGTSSGGTATSGGTTSTTKKNVDEVKKAVDGTVKSVTGGGTSTPTKAPDPVKTVSKTVASTTCLAKVGVTTIAGLLLPSQKADYAACMKTYGY